MKSAIEILQDKVNKEIDMKSTKCLFCGRPSYRKCCAECWDTLSIEGKILVEREERNADNSAN